LQQQVRFVNVESLVRDCTMKKAFLEEEGDEAL
jgi:hypothetical protein